jgi:hypothetical protein
MENKDRYDQIRAKLIINMHSLDDEVVQLPGLLNEAIEHEALAMAMRDNAKNRLSFIVAQTQAHLRDVVVYDENNKIKKRTESEYKELAEISDPVQEAQGEHETFCFEYNLWRGLTEGLRMKASSLKRLNELTVCGYITPSSQRNEQHMTDRAQIAQKRKPILSSGPS